MADTRADIAARMRRGLDVLYHGQLDKIVAVLCFYYSFITLSHYLVLPADIRFSIMAGSGLAALVSGATWLLHKMGKITPAASHMAFVPAGLCTLLAVYSHVFITGEQLQLTNCVLITFAFAFATLSRRIFTGIFVIGTTLYATALFTVPGPDLMHFGFMYIAAAALTVMCFVLRFRTVYGLERVLISNRNKASKLVEASHRIKAEMEEAHNAAEEAERANAAKDVFLANTTHELRTPLTGVLGMLQDLSESDLTEEQADAVSAARFSAETLLVVVNDLLDVAKLDAGRVELKPVPFMPRMVVAHVSDLLRAKAEAKSLSLIVDGLSSTNDALIGDPARIGQILLNLLDNAIKFTSEGEIRVKVAVERTEMVREDPSLDRATLALTVSDTGRGFSEADRDRLFARFEQLAHSSDQHIEGAGLGLSVSQSLAEQMGGRITAQGESGKGATFRFAVTLPVADAVAVQDLALTSKLAGSRHVGPKPPITAAQTAARGADQAGLRVLLAEDNQVNQMLVQKLAGKFGWELDIAENGQEAVDMVAADSGYDLVLMDIRMPVLDGVEAARAIRALQGDRAAVPIIALTANTGEETEARYFEAGMDAVVGKPIDASILKKCVDARLSAGAAKGDWAHI